MVEVTTSLGVLPREKYEDIKPVYIKAAEVTRATCITRLASRGNQASQPR